MIQTPMGPTVGLSVTGLHVASTGRAEYTQQEPNHATPDRTTQQATTPGRQNFSTTNYQPTAEPKAGSDQP